MPSKGSALALALGAGGGLTLWYLLRGKNTKSRSPSPVASASPTPASTTTPSMAAASADPPPVQIGCTIRLDETGLTVDGARVGIDEAVKRCKLAGLADVIASQGVPAAAYAELVLALGRAGIPAFARRNSLRNARPRTVGDVDLPSFALMVQALADEVEPDPTPDGLARGRFGDRKVFIAAIRRELHATKYASLSRAAIDELLFRAHRERLLVLSRADLVAVMDPDELRDSEIVTDGARFHFVVVEPSAARNARTHRPFTPLPLIVGRKASPRRRRFPAERTIKWADPRERLGAAGTLDPSVAGNTQTPDGWMPSVDFASFPDELAESFSSGGSDDE